MQKLALVTTLALAASAFAAPIVYDVTNTLAVQNDYGMTVTLMNDGVDFLRVSDIATDFTEGPQLNALAMGGGFGSIIGDNNKLEFDIRYYQTGEGNGIPAYNDDNAFLMLEVGGFLGFMNPVVVLTAAEAATTVNGDWRHVVVDITPLAGAAPMSYFCFSGANGRGVSTDYFDVTNLVATPEPASLSLIALGALSLLRRR